MADAFHLDVVSPEAVLWSGEALMLLTRSTEGEMGILAHHQPLMASLVPWDAVITPLNGPKVVLAVRGGFLQVVSNRVTLLTDLAEFKAAEVLTRGMNHVWIWMLIWVLLSLVLTLMYGDHLVKFGPAWEQVLRFIRRSL